MSAKATKNDFPTWFAPAVVKELRQGLRTPAFMITMALIPVAMSLLFMGGFIRDRYDDPFIPAEGVNVIFWCIICFSLLAIFPLRALQGVKGEVSSRTADMLMLTRLTPWRIVWGKWISYTAQILLTVCTLLPFLFVRYYYGSVNVVEDLYWLLLIVIVSCLATAMTLWVSGLHAFLKTPYTLGLLVLAGFFLSFIIDRDSMLQDSHAWLFITYALVAAIMVVLVFLVLASQFFSLPADNTSMRLRWLLLALVFAPYGFFVYMAINHSPFSDTSGVIFIILLLIAQIVLILDLMSPAPFLPVHVAGKGNRFKKWINNLLFVPGFFSSSLFSLLFIIILFGAYNLVCLLVDDPVPLHDKITVALYMMMIWSGMVITGYFLLPLQNKLNRGLQFVYFITIGLLTALASLLQFWKLNPIAMIVPWGNLTVEPFIERNRGLNEFSTYYLAIITLLFVGACICTVKTSIAWRRTINKSRQLDYLDE